MYTNDRMQIIVIDFLIGRTEVYTGNIYITDERLR